MKSINGKYIVNDGDLLIVNMSFYPFAIYDLKVDMVFEITVIEKDTIIFVIDGKLNKFDAYKVLMNNKVYYMHDFDIHTYTEKLE